MRIRLLAAALGGMVVALALALALRPAAPGDGATAAGDPLAAVGGGPQPAAAPLSRAARHRNVSAVRIAARQDDPDGGDPWAVRTYRLTSPGVRRPGSVMACAQLGREHDGTFGWIDGAERFTAVPAGGGGAPAECTTLPSNESLFGRPAFALTRFSDLPGEPIETLQTVRWELTDPDRGRATLRVRPTGSHVGPRVEYRLPDPSGGLPWGMPVTATGGRPACLAWPQQVVGDAIGVVDRRLDAVTQPFALMRPCVTSDQRPPTARRPFDFVTSTSSDPGPADPTLTARRVARRSLQGRTIVAGLAHPDVVAVTIASPRDVRTLTPSPREHVFAVVYDGTFPTGEIVVSARMRDGTTHRESVYLWRG